ncbi:nucleotidyltransferase domain-containing protein [Vulcanisaeta sp. JCM 14467]|uniref:nucleotidyltransferase domain-containing protein n=1 Tax=Vulcanisaeta sp. JCM 14467 TaxID=1295370 RepID=UPI0006D06B42|nr:nucleotidyltransferase domain-containing protein [Vulcanisaeta sp. JCM 14467]
MYSRWLEVLNEVTRLREARFREVLSELCGRSLVVVLFGSRARGDNTPLSDWDLMAIVPSGEYRVEALDIGQVVWLPLSRLGEVLEHSMIILDAVTDGKVLCGDSRVFEEVRGRVNEYVKERNLVRTRDGWFPRSIVR